MSSFSYDDLEDLDLELVLVEQELSAQQKLDLAFAKVHQQTEIILQKLKEKYGG